ncbi:MAG: hypothetical protein IJD09_00370 [Clostridia bacterium]|nr:hypothetical protein [Clostridia bacterium]
MKLEYGLIIGLVLFYFYTVTCTFVAAQLARLKGRRRAWCWLALFLGLIGVMVICFLPNAKGITGETNPIKMALRKLTGVSPLVTWIFVAGLVVVVGGALLATHLTTVMQNKAHEKELTAGTVTRQTYSPPSVNGPLTSISCGLGQNLAVTQGGELYGWGAINMTALDQNGKLYDNVQKVQMVGDTCFVLTKNGVLYARGDNSTGLIPGQTAPYVDAFVQVEPDVKDFSLSQTAGALIKNTGNLYVFGSNIYGQLGLPVEKITNTDARLAQNVQKVVVTARSLFYLATDGNVYGCGSNAYGQFGLGNTDAQAIPALLAGGCKDLAAGDDFAILLKTDGTVWTAGSDALGQLGRETLEESDLEPAEGVVLPPSAHVFGQVTGLTGATGVKAGGSTALALVNTDLYGWGDDRLDQLDGGDALSIKAPKKLRSKVALFDTAGPCVLVYTTEGKLVGAGDRRDYKLGTDRTQSGFAAVTDVKGGKS